MTSLDTILSIIVGVLIFGAAVYVFRSRKYEPPPDREQPPWEIPLQPGKPEPQFSAEDRQFFEEVLGVDVDEHREFLRPLAELEETQGVHFRDLYVNNEDLARNFWEGVAHSYFEEKHYDQAADSYLKSLGFHLKQSAEETAETAQLRCNLGIALTETGRSGEAIHQFEKSLHFNNEQGGGNHEVIAALLHNLGWAWETEGDNTKALDYYQRSLALCEEIGDEDGVENLKPKIQALQHEK
ncbi:tetratricopeptide repeat protein [Nitrospina gracilis]|uniref:tetratricopeptide repeat protein n=1 Tax=Nitrospina gracilis TaxID=35801 RepID=UPI001F1DEA5A|nr:tetratricopeptide repeat protein [Nitrospina gracilis]MCF8721962.1 tetratricopeptide (TPR) repeat protein [Nitrospina gracilis Nb-211]